MLKVLLGWFFIIIGVVFLLWPGLLRRRLQKKSMKYVRRALFLVTVPLAWFLIVTGLKYEGLLSKVLMVAGIIGIFKAFFLLKAKAAEKIIDWFLKRPAIFFRAAATFQIVLGIIILSLNK